MRKRMESLWCEVSVLLLVAVSAQALNCQVPFAEYLGDGYCDTPEYNSAACDWDQGDCCEADCTPGRGYTCGANGFNCVKPATEATEPPTPPPWDEDSTELSFFFVNELRDWASHEAGCNSDGEFLSIHSEAEAMGAQEKCGGGEQCYFGLTRSGTGGDWSFTDGSEVEYDIWASGEPADEDLKAYVDGSTGFWVGAGSGTEGRFALCDLADPCVSRVGDNGNQIGSTDQNCHAGPCCRSLCQAEETCYFYAWTKNAETGDGCRLYTANDVSVASTDWIYCSTLRVIDIPEEGPECRLTDGADYHGTKATTISGLECQDWASQTPHSHYNSPEDKPYFRLEANYCRNPDGSDGAWCYTLDPNTRWELCGITCEPCRPQCAGRECGTDGCGGTCGTCDGNDWSCNEESGTCEITGCHCTGEGMSDDPESTKRAVASMCQKWLGFTDYNGDWCYGTQSCPGAKPSASRPGLYFVNECDPGWPHPQPCQCIGFHGPERGGESCREWDANPTETFCYCTAGCSQTEASSKLAGSLFSTNCQGFAEARQCTCTGQSSSAGGESCRVQPDGNKWCYCSSTCPNAVLGVSGDPRNSFRCSDCEDLPQEDICMCTAERKPDVHAGHRCDYSPSGKKECFCSRSCPGSLPSAWIPGSWTSSSCSDSWPVGKYNAERMVSVDRCGNTAMEYQLISQDLCIYTCATAARAMCVLNDIGEIERQCVPNGDLVDYFNNGAFVAGDIIDSTAWDCNCVPDQISSREDVTEARKRMERST